MKKILFILLIMCMGVCTNAQGIIGKWKTNKEYKSGFECWSEIEYKNNNTFIVKMLMRFQDERYLDNGVLVDVVLTMNGKYEYSGKAFSHTFDENSITIDTEVSFTPECTVSEENRRKIRQIFKEQRGDDSEIRSMAKMYISGGMYKQILLLNHERMILGRPGGKAEEFTRIISEEELSVAKSKREAERAKWKAPRMLTLKKAAEDEAADYISKFKAEHPGARTTESGLVYNIQEKGMPGTNALSDNDVVHVNYRGYYLNGLAFDLENDIELRLNRVIPGWCEGVKMVGEGGQITMVVPYSLAYGENGSGIIPPYSTLVYDVDVLTVQSSDESVEGERERARKAYAAQEEERKDAEEKVEAERLAAEKARAEQLAAAEAPARADAEKKAEGERVAVAKKAEDERRIAERAASQQYAGPVTEEIPAPVAVVEGVKKRKPVKKANDSFGVVQSVGVCTGSSVSEHYQIFDTETDSYKEEYASHPFYVVLDYSIGYRFPSGVSFGVLFEGTKIDFVKKEPSGLKLFACLEARLTAMSGRVRPFIAGGLGRHLTSAKQFHSGCMIDPWYGKGGVSCFLGGKKSIDLGIGWKAYYEYSAVNFSLAFSF